MATSRRRRKSSSSAATTGSSFNELLDCTGKCQLLAHAHVVLRIAALGNLDLFKHCFTYCGNPWNISDETDRTPLHIASSKGHSNIVSWLLRRKGSTKRINSVDLDSCWSPLHRAAYFGYPGIMIQLIRAGANIHLLDNDKCSPLNILQNNYVDLFPAVSEVSLYVWGSNSNMTLGHDKCRSIPELMDTTPPLGNVVLCKFHTLILTERGRVYSCGHGTGGRLGHNNENTVVSPKIIEALVSESVIEIAAARNHSVFLTENGLVYTCGINDAQQLGHSVKTGSTILTPLLIKPIKSKHIDMIGAGRYHTAVASNTQVFSFGKNLGQLGYGKSSNMQSTPRIITGIVVDEGDTISYLSVSDAATACVTSRRHQIFVCTNYSVLRCERYNFPDSLSINQFVVCASLGELDKKRRDVTSEPNEGGSGLMIALLDSENKLWFAYWSEYTKKGCVPPKVIHGATKISVTHFTLTKNLTIVTSQGEIYTGPVLLPTPSLLGLKRITFVQQAKKVFTDFKAVNMSFLQNVYSPLELPLIEQSSFTVDIHNLLSEIELPHSIADVEINVNGTIFTANSFILSSNSSLFSSIFSFKSLSSSPSSIITSYTHTAAESLWHITLNTNISSEIFQLLLYYMYGGHVIVERQSFSPCTSKLEGNTTLNTTSKSSLDNTSGDDTISTNTDWNILYDQFGDGGKNPFDQFSCHDNKPCLPTVMEDFMECNDILKHVHETSSWLQDLRSLLELAESLRVQSLVKRLNSFLSSNGGDNKESSSSRVTLNNELILKLHTSPHDVLLISEEGKEIKCHKCILVTRSDYFQSMLLMGWRESSCEDGVTKLELPISYNLLEVIVNYLYKDTAVKVEESTSLEFITSALIVADQFLLSRLKSICEHSLSKCISIRNTVDILEFSMAYNAVKLQETSLQFICNNLSILLENGSLECLPNEILDLISDSYRDMFSVTKNRLVKMREPIQEELPVSYLQNKILEFSESEDESKLTGQRSTTPTRPKSPYSDFHNTATNSLRKKKKKRSNSINKEEKNHHTTGNHTNTVPMGHVTYTPPPSPGSPDILSSLSIHTLNEEEDAPLINEPISSNDLDYDKGEEELQGLPGLTPPVWSRSLSAPDTCNSLKDIMNEEIKKNEKKKLTKPIPYSSINTGSNNSKSTSGHHHESSKSTIEKRTRSESNESSNPWGTTPPVTAQVVSLRDLMAAEEEKSFENQTKKKQSIPTAMSLKSPPPPSQPSSFVRRSLSYEDTSGKDVMATTQSLVSFAEIVNDQMKEMNFLSEQQSVHSKKPLHLIQIEEKAIEQLKELYRIENNFDEFTTIQCIPAAANTNSSHSKKKTKPLQSSVWTTRTHGFK